MELGGQVVGGGLSLDINKGGVQLSEFFSPIISKNNIVFFSQI